MWSWLKNLFGSVSMFLKPLLMKLSCQVGTLVCAAASEAVKAVAETSSNATWQEKLDVGVTIAVAQLERQGLKLGIDFFLNEVIGAITASIAKNYEDNK